MLVTNLTSPRSGRPVANQYCIIMDDGSRIFQSYNSIICKVKPMQEIEVAQDAWLSRTTKKYLAVFLGISVKDLNSLLPNVKRF